MIPRRFLILAASVSVLCSSGRAELFETDIVIFGGTSSGVAAAVQAHRMGKSAIIAEWTTHLGGLTTGGLGATDIGNKAAIGGIAREFYETLSAYYDQPSSWTWEKLAAPEARHAKNNDPLVAKTGKQTQWTFEPHVAMDVYKRWLAEAGVKANLGERLKTVKKEGTRIVEFTTESGNVYRGKMFIDASYEGDLMAKAGVTYHVGREANAEYGETLNGIRAKTPGHQFEVDVDPYVKPGDPSSGLIPLIQAGDGGTPGEGDKAVQAYNYRLCLTRVPENQVPFTEMKPAGYDEKRYELLARYIEAKVAKGRPPGDLHVNATPMPNHKTDSNNQGPFSSDYIGSNYAFPEADYPTRERIAQEHRDYILGMFYFLSTSDRLPPQTREGVRRWGFAKDEFPETAHFPSQMYVREARRMISDYVMTEADCRWQRKAEDGVALGAYGMDSHNCQRIVQNGVVRNEGNTEVGVSGPYPVSYRSIVPKADQAENLFVPVCLSATHIAYGSIRMEPVFMITGQSSATAAALAIDGKTSVQKIDYAKLRTRLVTDGQIVEWTGAGKASAAQAGEGIDAKSLPGVVLDDADGQFKGDWTGSHAARQFLAHGYQHDANELKGQKSVTFRPTLKEPGDYEIVLLYPPNENRAGSVPVTVQPQGGEAKVVKVNQKKLGTQYGTSLGKYHLAAGQSVSVTVSNEGTEGFVVVDGLQVIKQ